MEIVAKIAKLYSAGDSLLIRFIQQNNVPGGLFISVFCPSNFPHVPEI